MIIYLFSVFISSISQIILKASADRHYKNVFEEYVNPRVIIAYGLFFLASFMTILAYKEIPLSMGAILEAAGYIFVAALSCIFLKEKVGVRKRVGLLVIFFGMVLYHVNF